MKRERYRNIIRLGLIVTLLINFPSNARAQNEIKYSEVVEVTEASKDELYSNGLIWFAETFKDSKVVIEAKDREAGMIIGNGTFVYSAPSGMKYRDVNGHIEFTIKVLFKEGRTKIELTTFTHKPNYTSYSLGVITESENYPYEKVNKGISDKWHQNVWNDLKNDVPPNAIFLLNNYKKFMIDNAIKSDDW